MRGEGERGHKAGQVGQARQGSWVVGGIGMGGLVSSRLTRHETRLGLHNRVCVDWFSFLSLEEYYRDQ